MVEWEEEGKSGGKRKGEGGGAAIMLGLVDKNYEWNEGCEKKEDLLTTGKEAPGVGLADLSAQ